LESHNKAVKIAIVTCVNENWLAPACVTLLSVSRNLKNKNADLFIVADKLTKQAQQDVDAFAKAHRIEINLKIHSQEVFSGINAHRYSSATFLRLCLPEVIPNHFDRMLYLDSDVLAYSDLTPLLNFDLKGNALCAVPEVKMAPSRGILTDRHRRFIGIPKNQDYFNAGVLLFDWPQTCAKRLLERSRDILLSGKPLPFLDQDALNLVFAKNWMPLPLKWNVEQSSACYLGVEPGLRHFNHAAKPWAWPKIMGYAPHFLYYKEALKDLALSNFLEGQKRGNPYLANIEYYFRKASFHQSIFLRKCYAHLL
jgi:lipopolysaccharide biosynthesis glycosyltransferase